MQGENSPLCVGQCLDALELPREAVEPSALEAVSESGLLAAWPSFGIGLGSAAVLGRWLAQVTSRGLSLPYHCSGISMSVLLFSMWWGRVWRQNKVIFWLPWSIKNRLTPRPSRVASLSSVLVVGMCCFFLRSSVLSSVVNINHGIMHLHSTWEQLEKHCYIIMLCFINVLHLIAGGSRDLRLSLKGPSSSHYSHCLVLDTVNLILIALNSLVF